MTAVAGITPCLWFDGQAGEAIDHYLSIFKDGRLLEVSHYGDAGPGPKGSIMTARFEIAGLQLLALNGGPYFKFTEAISLAVNCNSQVELDELWDRLSEGGSQGQCGWVKDKFGLSWQVVPRALVDMVMDKDPAKSARVMKAMLQMTKIDIAALKAAYHGI